MLIKHTIKSRQQVKNDLLQKLLKKRAFWSYNLSSVDLKSIGDDLLIEKVLVHLDIDDINALFLLYSKEHIKAVWETRLCVQDPYYHGLNVMLAFVYFDINNPTRHIKSLCKQHLNILKKTADEWFSTTN